MTNNDLSVLDRGEQEDCSMVCGRSGTYLLISIGSGRNFVLGGDDGYSGSGIRRIHGKAWVCAERIVEAILRMSSSRCGTVLKSGSDLQHSQEERY